MRSILGGKQLHYNRLGPQESFEYLVDVPRAGTYALTARVVTPSWKQKLVITANGAADSVVLELPHTVGMWDTTAPVVIELKEGKNVLVMNHQAEGYGKGFSIHHFKLTPAK